METGMPTALPLTSTLHKIAENKIPLFD